MQGGRIVDQIDRAEHRDVLKRSPGLVAVVNVQVMQPDAQGRCADRGQLNFELSLDNRKCAVQSTGGLYLDQGHGVQDRKSTHVQVASLQPWPTATILIKWVIWTWRSIHGAAFCHRWALNCAFLD